MVVVVLYKLYALVLEARATAWAEQSESRAKGQAGFRKDFRRPDQLFIIRTLLQQAHMKSTDFTVAGWMSKRPVTWFPVISSGRCSRGVECQGGSWLHSNQCMQQTKHVCSQKMALLIYLIAAYTIRGRSDNWTYRRPFVLTDH